MTHPTIESTWNEFHRRLRQFILKRVADDTTADDILQDVFLRIHSRIETLRDDSKLESWIYQITRNAIVDYYRAAQSKLTEADWSDELGLAADPAAKLADEEDAEKQLAPGLIAMVEALPREYREAIMLTEFQGLTQKEFAARVGISVSGAKSRVQRARQKLKEMLLDCCHFEFDRLGQVLDYYPRADCCICACEPKRVETKVS